MSLFTLRSAMPASANDLYAWHARPGAFLRLNPPWERVEVVGKEGEFGTAPYRVTVRTPIVGPLKGRFVSEAYDFRPGEGFQDRQIEGPFAFWNHTHTMIPNGPDASFIDDRIEYRIPLRAVGRLFGERTVRNRLRAMFAYRHVLTASDLRRHGLYRDRPRLKVAVTGSRGLVGSNLVLFLTTGGHAVTRLVSGSGAATAPAGEDGTRYVSWAPQAKLDPAALDGCDAVIHLAGDSIAEGKWTAAKRKKILESRSVPTRNLAEAVAALPPDRRPKVFLSASAVGIYGDRGDNLLTEDAAPAGGGFLAGVCKVWEEATAPASAAGVRVVHLRTGVVLTPTGGALGKQLPAFKAGAGAVLGTGKQWVPWISVDDLVGAIHHCLMTDALTGPVNLVAPNPVQNRTFTKTLGRVLGRPAFLWLPRAALKVMFGDIADEALLASTRAVPRKLLDTGFVFDHPDLEPALRFLLGRV
ncbi:MAG: hypothetical protein JWO38_4192 [Gemmataceae bacterium]|nr:hypothetical protein [Gemmataceae bacterium]